VNILLKIWKIAPIAKFPFGDVPVTGHAPISPWSPNTRGAGRLFLLLPSVTAVSRIDLKRTGYPTRFFIGLDIIGEFK
jgi:hypothetical protein